MSLLHMVAFFPVVHLRSCTYFKLVKFGWGKQWTKHLQLIFMVVPKAEGSNISIRTSQLLLTVFENRPSHWSLSDPPAPRYGGVHTLAVS